jgi:hypothetical protein
LKLLTPTLGRAAEVKEVLRELFFFFSTFLKLKYSLYNTVKHRFLMYSDDFGEVHSCVTQWTQRTFPPPQKLPCVPSQARATTD